MQIILMRHGETDCNKDGIWMGRKLDVSINDAGRAQIQATIPELRTFNPDLIIASPMKRTKESAEIIEESLGVPIEFDDRLMEIDVGSVTGKTREEAAELLGMPLEEVVRLYRVGEYDYTNIGGESAQHILSRIKSFLVDLAQREEQSVIVMSHGGIVRTMHRIISGSLSLADQPIPNATLIVLSYDGNIAHRS